MDASLMELFGPWLRWLFGIGLILLVGGIAAIQTAPVFEAPAARKIGRLASGLGMRMVLAAVACYFLIWALTNIFENMMFNLPGT